METKLYTCQYCFKEFEPKRRRVQKFCSNTCRSKAHHAKSTKITKQEDQNLPSTEIDNAQTSKKETISVAGVANAAAGAAIADLSKKIFTPKHKAPATKQDIEELKKLITDRYFIIKNLHFDEFGRQPYYDIETEEVVYLNYQ